MPKKILRLNDYAVREILKNPLLQGKKPIGRGMFSMVFEGTRKNTVLKLTADNVNYWMLNCYVSRVRHRHFPRVVEDHGNVGHVMCGGKELAVYLYEMEKLDKVRGQAKRIARMVGNAQRSSFSKFLFNRSTELTTMTLADMSENKEVPRSVRNALIQLEAFSSNFPDSSPDMHMGNFMQRRSGELVITDPLMDVSAYNALYSRH